MRLGVFSVYGREIALSVQSDDLVHTIKLCIGVMEGFLFEHRCLFHGDMPMYISFPLPIAATDILMHHLGSMI